MSPDEFARATDFLCDSLLPRLGAGGKGSFLSIEYVGGEIMTVPEVDLKRIVFHARERFSRLFDDVRDGVQSNLIASEARVSALDILFGGRVGTSVDDSTDRRTVGGSGASYREIARRSEARIARRRGRPPGAIYVVDREGVPGVGPQIAKADADGRNLVLRPVFEGGSAVDKAGETLVAEALGEACEDWIMRSRVHVEPFSHLLKARLATLAGTPAPISCPFQRNCADVSLDLEPNGDLYVCLDMADSGQAKLGNALAGEFDEATWARLRTRGTEVDPTCAKCPWFAACQGGCMSEAIRDTGVPFGRPRLCAAWTSIFRKVDSAIDAHGPEAVSGWLVALDSAVSAT